MSRGKLPEEEKCQKEERSMSWVIRKALAEWLPKHMDD